LKRYRRQTKPSDYRNIQTFDMAINE